MTLAISSLFKDPQNNLRVFKDSVVMPSQLDSLAETCSKLLSHFEGLSADAFMTKICVHILQKTKILQLLKKLQRLDSVDIEVISMLWDRSKTSDKPISDQEVLDQLQESLAKMKHRAILYDGEESTSDVCSRVVRSSNPITACMKDIPTWTRAEVLSMISDFLLATAMKDCSVMITFATFDRTQLRPLDENSLENVIFVDRVPFVYKVNVIDVDPRSVSNIEKYKALDDNVIQYAHSQC
eukprot:TRINITY_DN2897_c0_g1_i12.p1 TRINITY_DN2897_c0_g1~~TRINITY_DN2897_c0_g1_i12.p1  ORF type:complete len:240 (-),score=37.08 TRINITY_DN2897_c0_g1_i12:130-849(-)